MLKATIAGVLALSAVLSVSACNRKSPDTAAPAATAAPATPMAGAQPTAPANHPPAKASAEVNLSGIAKADGGKTVAELFADKDKVVGQKVAVRGKVVKTNSGIMGKDWVHVRDGSGEEGSNDLTVTTVSTPAPKVGDTVLVNGTVAVNKDFGMGYSYPVMLEDADVKVEAAAQ